MGTMQKTPHPESCYNCTLKWYNDTYYDATPMGEDGWVCDGVYPGKANLKGFPFVTKQKCFTKKEVS